MTAKKWKSKISAFAFFVWKKEEVISEEIEEIMDRSERNSIFFYRS